MSMNERSGPHRNGRSGPHRNGRGGPNGNEGTVQPDPPALAVRPALGTRGGPASWSAAGDAPVALARPGFSDARWSFLYAPDETSYAAVEPEPGEVAAANRRMRAAPMPDVRGPFLKAPVWSSEVPLYFWAGGVASGAAFVAVACEAAGDAGAAIVARRVALGAALPCPVLLVADLGRPERFLNMLRIFKPRSPMSTGAWCLVAFSGASAAAVVADALRMHRSARVAGAVSALLGAYLGSYTGVLLSCTAVPVWARSRAFLGPIFVSTSAMTGAAATRLALLARRSAHDARTDRALLTIEHLSLVAHVALSAANRRQLGVAGEALDSGRHGLALRSAERALLAGVLAKIAVRLLRRPTARELVDIAASATYLAAGLAVRMAWIEAGKSSAKDDLSAAAHGRRTGDASADVDESPEPRLASSSRLPLRLRDAPRAWRKTVHRLSLAIEHRVRPDE